MRGDPIAFATKVLRTHCTTPPRHLPRDYNFQQIQAKPYAIKMAESDWGDFEFDDSGPTPIPRPSSKITRSRNLSSLLLPAKRMNLTHHRACSARVWPSKLHEYSHLPRDKSYYQNTTTTSAQVPLPALLLLFRGLFIEKSALTSAAASLNTSTNCTFSCPRQA